MKPRCSHLLSNSLLGLNYIYCFTSKLNYIEPIPGIIFYTVYRYNFCFQYRHLASINYTSRYHSTLSLLISTRLFHHTNFSRPNQTSTSSVVITTTVFLAIQTGISHILRPIPSIQFHFARTVTQFY